MRTFFTKRLDYKGFAEPKLACLASKLFWHTTRMNTMNQVAQQNELLFAAYVGLDWADEKHAGALCAAGGPTESFELEQSPDAIDQWAARLRKRFDGKPI